MRTKIIISKKIEEFFHIKLKSWLALEKIDYVEIEDFPHYLTDSDLSDGYFYIAVCIHSLADYSKQFCVHPPGNWGELWPHPTYTHLGGEERKLSMSSALLVKNVYSSLLKNNNLSDYVVNLECTHHGPAVSKPIVFLEIGCSPSEWQDQNALSVIKKVIKENTSTGNATKKASVLIGGGHYMKSAQRLLEREDMLITHMCPSSQIHQLTLKSITEVIENSYEPVQRFIIDLAGVGQHQQRITDLIRSAGHEVVFLHELL